MAAIEAAGDLCEVLGIVPGVGSPLGDMNECMEHRWKLARRVPQASLLCDYRRPPRRVFSQVQAVGWGCIGTQGAKLGLYSLAGCSGVWGGFHMWYCFDCFGVGYASLERALRTSLLPPLRFIVKFPLFMATIPPIDPPSVPQSEPGLVRGRHSRTE
jgi:hypothetical protein